MTPERLHAYRAFIESWHDFYVMTGTAAVTLAGLLFMARSLHLEVLVPDLLVRVARTKQMNVVEGS